MALTSCAEKHAKDPDALLFAETSQVGAIVLHATAVDLCHFNPIARLTSDHLVVVARASSPGKTAVDLSHSLKVNAKTAHIGIGSLGGVDHDAAVLLA